MNHIRQELGNENWNITKHELSTVTWESIDEKIYFNYYIHPKILSYDHKSQCNCCKNLEHSK
jgi:hypothetical protein